MVQGCEEGPSARSPALHSSDTAKADSPSPVPTDALSMKTPSPVVGADGSTAKTPSPVVGALPYHAGGQTTPSPVANPMKKSVLQASARLQSQLKEQVKGSKKQAVKTEVSAVCPDLPADPECPARDLPAADPVCPARVLPAAEVSCPAQDLPADPVGPARDLPAADSVGPARDLPAADPVHPPRDLPAAEVSEACPAGDLPAAEIAAGCPARDLPAVEFGEVSVELPPEQAGVHGDHGNGGDAGHEGDAAFAGHHILDGMLAAIPKQKPAKKPRNPSNGPMMRAWHAYTEQEKSKGKSYVEARSSWRNSSERQAVLDTLAPSERLRRRY